MPTPDPWNPRLYDQFKKERSQPALDLMAMIEPKPDMRVIDLGCGTGELTTTLHVRLGASETLGIDLSDNMLAEAIRHVTNGLHFQKADVASFTSDEKYDLVFSNAVLMWIPGHETLLPRLTRLLAPDGQLAIQIVTMNDDPVHFIPAEIAREEPFRQHLNGFVHHLESLPPETYATLLYQLGFARQNVRVQVYPHVLPARTAVIEWIRGTLLTAYQQRLAPPVYEAFLARYQERVFQILPDARPVFYPYKRILMWGRR